MEGAMEKILGKLKWWMYKTFFIKYIRMDIREIMTEVGCQQEDPWEALSIQDFAHKFSLKVPKDIVKKAEDYDKFWEIIKDLKLYEEE